MAIEKHGIYKCEHCGNVVEVLTAAGPNIVCCGQPMEKLEANTVDASKEKHVPILEVTANGDLVKVGAVPHPMEEKHFIEWIAVKSVDGKIGRKFLKPGDKPEALFEIKSAEIAELYEYCNLHGLWKSTVTK